MELKLLKAVMILAFISVKNIKVKVKRSRYRPGLALRVGKYIALLFHARGSRRGEWSAARSGRTLHPGKPRHPLHRRLGGPQGRSGRAENLECKQYGIL